MSLDLAEAIALPPEKAIAWFRSKGHTISWNWQEPLQEANARAFTVAKVSSLDLLSDIRKAVDQALAEGRTEKWFEKTLTPVLQRAGWWGSFKTDRSDGGEMTVRLGSPARLRLIYRQNLQGAYMAGRWQEQARLARARPYLQYVAVLDQKTRDSHRALHGKVYRFDDPIWRTHYPPNGWGCRCRVRQLSEAALERRGLEVSSSEGQIVTQVKTAGLDYETGEITRIEVSGVRIGREVFWTDPGFSTNAGLASFMPDLDRYPADISRQYVQGVVTGPEFERWFRIWQRSVQLDTAGLTKPAAREAIREQRDRPAVRAARVAAELSTTGPELTMPVAVLPEALVEKLGVKSRTVQFSTSSLKEHLVAHPDVDLADYQRLQQLIEEGEFYQQGDRRIVLLATRGKTYRAAFKADADGKRLFLLSLFTTSEKMADRQVRDVLPRVR